jgi:pimeloyl-ACP methyl ester carboxylesterase
VDFAVSRGLTDIVLVGHSYGGTIISKVAEVIPDRIRRLVYWSGFVLNDGESLNDAVPPHFRDLFRDLADRTASRAAGRSGRLQPLHRGGQFISRNTVAWHLHNVYRKLQTDSREQLNLVVEA